MFEQIERTPEASQRTYGREIQHQDIRSEMSLVTGALKTPDLEMVQMRLRQLTYVLKSHMADEESEDGWMAAIEVLEPKYIPALDELRTQHRGLLGMLDALNYLDGSNITATATWIREFIYLFDEHELAEEAIIEQFLLR